MNDSIPLLLLEIEKQRQAILEKKLARTEAVIRQLIHYTG